MEMMKEKLDSRIIYLIFIFIGINQASYYDDTQLYQQLKRSYEKRYNSLNSNPSYPEYVSERKIPVPEWNRNWPADYVSFDIGQVGGLAVCPEGNVHVFHRGNRVWDWRTFDRHDNYLLQDNGTLGETIEILSRKDAKCLQRLGHDKFYLPHGLTLSLDNTYYWLTDVATHQVHKYKIETDSIIMTLGKQFDHATDNDDRERFCKPSDVAIAPSGDIFISDGYCNNRIVKINKDGTFNATIGKGELTLPHSITLIPEEDLVCVADRESKPSRIICYTAGLTNNEMGVKVNEIKMNGGDEHVFAITYNPRDKVIYAVTQRRDDGTAHAYTLKFENGNLKEVSQWDPSEKEFDQPHDIAVSPKGDVVYVGMISQGSRKIWKFDV